MKPPLRAVIFDFDDTLFDDAACTRAGLAELARLHGVTRAPQDMFSRHATIIDDLSPRLFSGQITAHAARVERFSRLLAEWGVPDTDSDEIVCKNDGNPSEASRRKTGSGRGVKKLALSQFLDETDGIRMTRMARRPPRRTVPPTRGPGRWSRTPPRC